TAPASPLDARRDAPPSPRPVTCQMFETPLIERFSRIHPVSPFLFWLPVLGYRAYCAQKNGVGLLPAIGLFLFGVLLWTFAEYILHRYVFHYLGPRLWQRRMHFVLHGVHHDFPQDGGRLVMPLGASIPMAVGFYAFFRAVFGPVFVDPGFIGFGLGSLACAGARYARPHVRLTSRCGTG